MFILDVERIETHGLGEFRASGSIRLLAPVGNELMAADYAALDLTDGDRVSVPVQLFREDLFRNPGAASCIELLDQQGIDATGTIKSPLLVEKLTGEARFLPLIWIGEQRQKLILEFNRLFDSSTAGTLAASMLGNKYHLDRDTAEVYREGGTFHVLVISGLHITFIGGLLLLVVRRFTRSGAYQFAIVSTLLWIYAIIVGADVPVVRASLMFSILLFSRVIHRQRDLINSFALSAVILLAWRPSDLFEASFQLTFASVGSIVIMAFPLIEKLRAIGSWTPGATQPFPPNVPKLLRRFCETLYWDDALWKIEQSRQIWSAGIFKAPLLAWPRLFDLRKAAAYMFEGLMVSLIVQVWLLPLSVIYFHRFAPISIILNLWVGPLIAIESFVALAAVIVARLSSTAAVPFVHLTESINWALLALPHYAIDFTWASWRVPVAPNLHWVYPFSLLAVSALGITIFRWQPFRFTQGRRAVNYTLAGFVFILVVCGTALIVFHPGSSPEPDGRLRLDFLDVGQGDATLITFPNGATMLIDGGGKPNFGRGDDEEEEFEPDLPRIGEVVVSEFLWESGRSHIDYIVATHADADHIQGLVDVASNFSVGKVLVPRLATGDDDFDRLVSVISKKKIPIEVLRAGSVVEIGGVQIQILWPPSSISIPASSENDGSLVLKLNFGTRSILMTGDIERSAETQLFNQGAPLRADVVKVPHHGSRTSSTQAFVDAVDPDVAVIPVGNRSRFGHPHSEVLSRWLNAGAWVVKTGESGTITVSTDGADLCVRGFSGIVPQCQ